MSGGDRRKRIYDKTISCKTRKKFPFYFSDFLKAYFLKGSLFLVALKPPTYLGCTARGFFTRLPIRKLSECFSLEEILSGGERKGKMEAESFTKRGRIESLPYRNCPAPFAVSVCREQESRFGSVADIQAIPRPFSCFLLLGLAKEGSAPAAWAAEIEEKGSMVKHKLENQQKVVFKKIRHEYRNKPYENQPKLNFIKYKM